MRQGTRPGKHWTWDGRPKRAHATRDAAIEFARTSGHVQRSGRFLVPYECDECAAWHLGNDSLPNVSRIRRARWEHDRIELGERAASCAMVENVGSEPKRKTQLAKRLLSAQKKTRRAAA